MIQKGFDIWYAQFQAGNLHKNNYSRLIRSARQIGRIEIADQVKEAQNKLEGNNAVKWYNEDNLASDSKNYLPEINQ